MCFKKEKLRFSMYIFSKHKFWPCHMYTPTSPLLKILPCGNNCSWLNAANYKVWLQPLLPASNEAALTLNLHISLPGLQDHISTILPSRLCTTVPLLSPLFACLAPIFSTSAQLSLSKAFSEQPLSTESYPKL